MFGSCACVQLASQIFGVTVEAATNDEHGKSIATWHADVRVFKVLLDGKLKAWFYLDPYSRPAGARQLPE